MAEKEGFEPSNTLWVLHDFQSCALDQLRDFSVSVKLNSYIQFSLLTIPNGVDKVKKNLSLFLIFPARAVDNSRGR